MKHIKVSSFFAILLGLAFSGFSFAQGPQKIVDWLPANDESVRLDPGNYHRGRTYRPGPNGGNIYVHIKALRPVTIFLTGAEERSSAAADGPGDPG